MLNLANTMHIVKGLVNMCLDCRNKETDCLVIKIGKCPFKEGTCSKMTSILWLQWINSQLNNMTEEEIHQTVASMGL